MALAVKALVFFVALEHVGFLVLEMFLWRMPVGRRVFRLTEDFAKQSKGLAANQGLYNGFLAAGLFWGLLHPDPATGSQVQVFFLACVLVAGVYGALSVKKTILFVQGLPAALALVLLHLAK